MRITPKTEHQIAQENLWPDGEYDFEVTDAIDGISQSSGRPMMTISLTVHSDGRTRTIKDYLMEAMAFKLRHFFYAIGLGAAYESGDLNAEQLVGRAGRVLLKQEIQKGYAPKNSVKDYVVPDEDKAASTAAKDSRSVVPAPAAIPADDGIPF